MPHRHPVQLSEEILGPLLKKAILAPSSHNTQPWSFKIHADRVDLYADRIRALPVNDPDDRELVISCGCALMNLRVAAETNGTPATVELLPRPDDPDLLASIAFSASRENLKLGGLFAALATRRTYRRRFADKAVPAELCRRLEREAEWEGAWFEIVAEDSDRNRLAELVAEGDAIQWSDPRWRRELAAWMHPRRQGDGLTVPGLVAPLAQAVVRTFDMGGGIGARDGELAGESPLLAVLGTAGDARRDWLRAGQALERVLLAARSEGLQASFLNQPVQVASLRPQLQELLAAKERPQVVLRLGYSRDDIPATPRRELSEIVEP